MVLLTMTPAMVDGLAALAPDAAATAHEADGDGPSLAEPAVGRPISHAQVVDLWTRLSSRRPSQSLEALLRGARVYVPPPPPRPEPSDEYKALMARLRREAADRAYERIINPPPRHDTFDERFPHAARSFAEANRVVRKADLGDDDVTYSDMHRQVMLLVNFVVSIVGVAATLWIAARWWSLPARLLLTLSGSIAVAIAEVGVYQGYVWRMGQAKTKQRAAREVREVVKTWVVGPADHADGDRPVLLKGNDDDDAAEGALRRRARAPVKPET